MGTILIIAVAGLAAWLLSQNREAEKGRIVARATANTETSLEILAKRYARGEIDREEYETRKRDLI